MAKDVGDMVTVEAPEKGIRNKDRMIEINET